MKKEYIFNDDNHKEKIRILFQKDPKFTALGLFFGFSECCIDSFIENGHLKVALEHPEAPFIGTGFIPCVCCVDEAVNSWEEFQEGINKRRISTSVFPEYQNINEPIRFLCDLTLKLGHDLSFLSKIRQNEKMKKVIEEEIELKNNENKIQNTYIEIFKNKKDIAPEEIIDFCLINKDFKRKIEDVMVTLEKELKNALQISQSNKGFNRRKIVIENRAKEEIKDGLYAMINTPKINMLITVELINSITNFLYASVVNNPLSENKNNKIRIV